MPWRLDRRVLPGIGWRTKWRVPRLGGLRGSRQLLVFGVVVALVVEEEGALQQGEGPVDSEPTNWLFVVVVVAAERVLFDMLRVQDPCVEQVAFDD